jgi:hypothetical protein
MANDESTRGSEAKLLGEVFARFIKASPISVMARGVLENALSAEACRVARSGRPPLELFLAFLTSFRRSVATARAHATSGWWLSAHFSVMRPTVTRRRSRPSSGSLPFH